MIRCRDDPVFNEGIRRMVDEIVSRTAIDYMNAIIFFNKNEMADPLDERVLQRRADMADCERFFLEDYGYMTGGDGERAIERYKSIALSRESYVKKDWRERGMRDGLSASKATGRRVDAR